MPDWEQKEYRYLGRCKQDGAGVSVMVRGMEMTLVQERNPRDMYSRRTTKKMWKPREGSGYTIDNYGVSARCPNGHRVQLQKVEGRYKPGIKCGAKCRNAIGPSCDCECAGANHGINV